MGPLTSKKQKNPTFRSVTQLANPRLKRPNEASESKLPRTLYYPYLFLLNEKNYEDLLICPNYNGPRDRIPDHIGAKVFRNEPRRDHDPAVIIYRRDIKRDFSSVH